MKITENAKAILLKLLTENKAEAIKFSTQSSCCGQSLSLDLANGSESDKPELIDGVPSFIDEETQAWTSEVTIDAQGEELMLVNPNSGCGSCAGCEE